MRDQILSEIRRFANASGGKPPGRSLFEAQTGIPTSAWYGVYWSKWSQAVEEAGFTPNTFNKKLNEEFVLTKFAQACRHFGKVPTAVEARMYKRVDPEFPSKNAVLSSGKADLLHRLAAWVRNRKGYEDVASMLGDLPSPVAPTSDFSLKVGLVYLIKSGTHYKIGRSDEIERRIKEIRLALPEAANLIHAIRTDDPPGIEAYWHRRFADRRANGEWFRLTNADVLAFQRRKFQ